MRRNGSEAANKDTCPQELSLCGQVFFVSQKRRTLCEFSALFFYVTLLISIIAISGELLRSLGTGYGSLDNYKFIFKSKIERH